MAMTAQDRDVGSTLSGRDARMWEEDVLELFIKPLESSLLYYEFEFSPSNQIFDAYFVKRGSPLDEATPWNSGLRVAVAVDGTLNKPEDDDRGWSLELALPLADLHHAGNSIPKQGDVWKAAVCRYDYDARWEQPLNTATAPVTESGGFHSYEVYGPLQFKGRRRQPQPNHDQYLHHHRVPGSGTAAVGRFRSGFPPAPGCGTPASRIFRGGPWPTGAPISTSAGREPSR